MGGNELFFWPQHCSRGGGGGEVGRLRDEPKAEKKIVARSRVLRNNYLEELFHTVPSSFVLRHCCYTELYTLERIRLCVRNKS